MEPADKLYMRELFLSIHSMFCELRQLVYHDNPEKAKKLNDYWTEQINKLIEFQNKEHSLYELAERLKNSDKEEEQRLKEITEILNS